MNVLWAPLLLLGVVLLPLIPVLVLFQARKYGPLRFLFAVAAGVFSVLTAGLAQFFFPLHLPDQGQMGELLFSIFIRISLVEELSRVLTLSLLFHFIPYIGIRDRPALGAPLGLAAGLGFAAGESIFYGLSDPGIALLRVFTAALHGACGARIGSALAQLKTQPFNALSLFVSAVCIHGMYNFCILNPGVPWFFSAFIALSALSSSLINIYFSDAAKK